MILQKLVFICLPFQFDDVYDHPDQNEIHKAAQDLVKESKSDNPQLLQGDVESILTVYFKTSDQKFSQEITHLLKPIIDLSLTRNEKYCVFQTVLDRFIPKNIESSSIFDLARLLLLYHDPQLCNHIDSLKISFHQFSRSWFASLMAADCDPEVTVQLWDLYLVNMDPWIIFFMVTVMLVNFRDNILEVENDR